jgi:hypothetical protein
MFHLYQKLCSEVSYLYDSLDALVKNSEMFFSDITGAMPGTITQNIRWVTLVNFGTKYDPCC